MIKKMSFITNGGMYMSTGVVKPKTELIDKLSNLYDSFKSYRLKEKKAIETKIKEGLGQYKILPGEIQELMNDTDKLNGIDINKVYFLSEQTYEVTKRSEVNPKLYFTPREIKEIKTNFQGNKTDTVEFPYEFQNVVRINDDDYITSIKASEIKLLFENALLQYNVETQREVRQITKGDQIIEVPKIHDKSVKEMEELIEKGEIISSVITFNARLGSSDEGEELEYDEHNKILTVTKGTLLDVLDGFHRINAIVRALRKNPSIDTTFKLNILNFDKKRAKQYFAQMNTISAPIGKGHLKKMSESRQSDFIAKYVQTNSELSGKVAASDRIASNSNLLVTFNILSDSIDDVYKVEDKATAIQISKYLTEFINTLFIEFPEEFLGNSVSKVREESLINTNSMFAGYILLSKLMKDKGIPLEKLKNIINDINFSRRSSIWIDRKLINKEGRITATNAKNIIYKIFQEINLDKFKEKSDRE